MMVKLFSLHLYVYNNIICVKTIKAFMWEGYLKFSKVTKIK